MTSADLQFNKTARVEQRQVRTLPSFRHGTGSQRGSEKGSGSGRTVRAGATVRERVASDQG